MTAEGAVSAVGRTPADVPYRPSWVDQLTYAIERLPVPVWVSYLVLFAGVVLVVSALNWVAGLSPPGTIDRDSAAFVLVGIYLLGLLHYLNHVAASKMESFRPALDLDGGEFERLRYELTTLPARQGALVGLAGLAFVAFGIMSDPFAAGAAGVGSLHPAVVVARIAVIGFNFAVGGMLFYHTIRQLRLVSQIHALASRIDLFEPAPLYAFSNLTVRTGIGLVLIAAYGFVLEPSINAVTVASNALVFALATAAFVLPLRGMHQRLLLEKERLQLEADQRFKATIGELHRSVDEQNLSVADGLNKTLASLQLEREALSRLPTWPWAAGTLRAFISVLLVPIVLWLIFRALERVV
jgi:hypothetical protein